MIASYKDLEVYQESYQLALLLHQMTQKYPKFEKYEMGSQTRRAAVSIPVNIAEGYGKRESQLDFKRFLRMSLVSCNEV
jgi:four helix bundle protein